MHKSTGQKKPKYINFTPWGNLNKIEILTNIWEKNLYKKLIQVMRADKKLKIQEVSKWWGQGKNGQKNHTNSETQSMGVTGFLTICPLCLLRGAAESWSQGDTHGTIFSHLSGQKDLTETRGGGLIVVWRVSSRLWIFYEFSAECSCSTL